MRVTEVRVPRFNLGNAVTRETTIPSFLDGLGQLLTLLRTDSCVWRKEGDARVGADKPSPELHIPQVNVRLVIPAERAAVSQQFHLHEYIPCASAVE